MRSLLTFAALLGVFAVAGRAADQAAADPGVAQGLQLFESESNGLEACLQSWFSDKPRLAGELLEKMTPVTADLGPVLDAEVVATQRLSQRVQRYYIAVNYTRRPLWIRLDRYTVPDKIVSLDLKFSLNPDDILPSSPGPD